MPILLPSKTIWSALVSATTLQLALSAAAMAANEKPVVSLVLPADPHAPVMAKVTADGHSYRLIFDTGASDLVLHLPVAQRDFAAAPEVAGAPTVGRGLHGNLALQRFTSGPMALGDWRFQDSAQIVGTDLTAVVQAYGVDGLMGLSYLSQLDWHWNNRSQRLDGYPHGSEALAAVRSRLHCEALLDVDGMPGVAVRVGSEQAQFVLDTGDMGESGNLNTQDRDALEDRGAIQATATVNRHADVAGNPLPPLRITQIKNVHLATTRLDGLTFGEINNNSRFGRAFLSKFDEVVLDFGTGKFCYTDVAQVDPDDMSYWLPASR